MTTVRHSFPHVFKSRYYVERNDWDAHFKVDYDTHKNPLSLTKIKRTFEYLKKRCYQVTRVKAYETGRGHHLRVWTNGHDIPAWTVLRIQSMFGDDPIRQKFNERRVRRRENGWSVLWNEKWRNGRLLSQEKFDQELTDKIINMLSIHDRFWMKVVRGKPNECWLWTGATVHSSVSKYGKFCSVTSRPKRYVLAHRFAYELTYGKPKHQVLHSCDTPLCCNPKHLEDGTQKKNLMDCVARGRFNAAKGEASGKAVLTERVVKQIVRMHQNGTRVTVIARELGLKSPSVSHVLSGRTWSHVTGF